MSRSRSWKPEGAPVISPFFIIILWTTFIASLVGSLMGLAPSLTRLWVTAKILASTWSTNSSIPPVKLKHSSTAPVAERMISRSRCCSRTRSMK